MGEHLKTFAVKTEKKIHAEGMPRKNHFQHLNPSAK